MSYAGLGINWSQLKADGGQEVVEFIKKHNPKNRFFLTGCQIKKPLAEYLLGRWATKRPLKTEVLEKLKAALLRKSIAYLGGFSTIHLDVRGNLVDLQHVPELLTAIVETKGSLEYNLHLGIEAQYIEDFRIVVPQAEEGTIPEPQKMVKVESVKAVYVMPYPIRPISLSLALLMGAMKQQVGGKKVAVTEKAAIQWCEKNDNDLLRLSISEGNNISRATSRFLTPSEWSAIRYVTAITDLTASSMFFDTLRSESPIAQTHPIAVLKKKFDSTHVYAAHTSLIRLATAVVAWNAYRAGQQLLDIVWTEDMEFPKVV